MCVALFVPFVSVCHLVERSCFSVNLVEFPESVHVRVGNHLPYFIIIFITHRCRSYPPSTGLKLFLIQIHCIIRSVLYNVYSELRVLIFKVTFKTSNADLYTCIYYSFSLSHSYLYLTLLILLRVLSNTFISLSVSKYIVTSSIDSPYLLRNRIYIITIPQSSLYTSSFFCIPLTAFVIFTHINNFFIETLATSRKMNPTILITDIQLKYFIERLRLRFVLGCLLTYTV